MTDEILTRKALAARLAISEEALAQMATRGTGPRYVKLSGRLVRYRSCDVERWLEENLVASTKDRGLAGPAAAGPGRLGSSTAA